MPDQEDNGTTAFSTDAEARFQALLARYPDRRSVLVPALRIAVSDFGFLSSEAMTYLAGRLEVPEAVVLNTASFYTMLHTHPVGRHHLEVCRNVACHLRGGDSLVEHLTHRLGIGPGEVTQDGRFSLETVECLAACGNAPSIRVDGRYHENVTPESIDDLLATLGLGRES